MDSIASPAIRKSTFKIPKLNRQTNKTLQSPTETHILINCVQPEKLKKLDKFKATKELENIAQRADLSRYKKMISISKTDEKSYFELTKACLHLEECAVSAPLYGTEVKQVRLRRIGKNVLELKTYVSFI